MRRKEGLGQDGTGSEHQAKEGMAETEIIASLLCAKFFCVRRVA